MKGILFGGCSFTWGQGLYFYSDLNRLVYPINEYTYNDNSVNDAHRKYRDTLRYPRLVANHFNTFEITKDSNGGREEDSFDFLNNIFNINETHKFEEIEYIILQTSIPTRNKFFYIDAKQNGTYKLNLPPRRYDPLSLGAMRTGSRCFICRTKMPPSFL